jgi:hypothetical protein
MSRKKKEQLLLSSVKIASVNPEPISSALPVYQGGFEKSQPVTQALTLREAKLIKDSAFDHIWKFLYDPKKPVELTDHEEDMLRRLSNTWDLLTGKVLNDRKAVKAHMQWCKDNFMQISERTAYDDIRRAKALYGDPRLSTAVFEKARISAVLLEQIEMMKSISDTGSTIDKIEAAKAINQLTRRFNAVNGLEDDIKTQLPRPAITINFNSDEATLKAQADELMKGVTIDVEYTEEPS